MKIYLTRHGETDWNIEHRIQGKTDIVLNTEGIKQVELITQKIANLKIDSIISSETHAHNQFPFRQDHHSEP